MPTYQLLSGETIDYPEPNQKVTEYLDRVRGAARDPAVTIHQMIELVYGHENPLLNTYMSSGRPMVTGAVFDNPLYHLLTDLIDHKRIQLGLLDLEKAHACYTLSVPEAAEQLGTTPEGVLGAIKKRRLAAIFKEGQWWVHPHGLASYRTVKWKDADAESLPNPSVADRAGVGVVQNGAASAAVAPGTVAS